MAIRDPLVAIRKKCLECSGGDKSEVASCELVECPLHSFRMGVTERKTAIPPVPPPRKAKMPDAAANQASGVDSSLSQDKPKDSKSGKVSATDQYTLF